MQCQSSYGTGVYTAGWIEQYARCQNEATRERCLSIGPSCVIQVAVCTPHATLLDAEEEPILLVRNVSAHE